MYMIHFKYILQTNKRNKLNFSRELNQLNYILLLLSDLGNARVIIEAVLLIETITPIYLTLFLTLLYNIYLIIIIVIHY